MTRKNQSSKSATTGNHLTRFSSQTWFYFSIECSYIHHFNFIKYFGAKSKLGIHSLSGTCVQYWWKRVLKNIQNVKPIPKQSTLLLKGKIVPIAGPMIHLRAKNISSMHLFFMEFSRTSQQGKSHDRIRQNDYLVFSIIYHYIY